jgi:hypothetical protein
MLGCSDSKVEIRRERVDDLTAFRTALARAAGG